MRITLLNSLLAWLAFAALAMASKPRVVVGEDGAYNLVEKRSKPRVVVGADGTHELVERSKPRVEIIDGVYNLIERRSAAPMVLSAVASPTQSSETSQNSTLPKPNQLKRATSAARRPVSASSLIISRGIMCVFVAVGVMTWL